MSRTISYVNAFTAGEIGELAWDRTDLQQIAKGCAEGLNMIGLVTGPQASRGGFLDRGSAKASATASRLVAFVRSSDDALFLELAETSARVWTPAGDLIQSGGSPYSFATPWTAAQVARLWFHQIGDVLYVTDRDGGATRVITRLADDNWTVALFDYREGPWLPEGGASGPALTADAVTGSVTLTDDGFGFVAGDVGSLVRIRQGDGASGYGTWTSDTDYDDNVFVQFDGRVYQRQATGGTLKSGTSAPLHSEGVVGDGKLFWTYIHDGAGIARITVVSAADTATATVIRQLPSTQPTRFWSKQAFSAVRGWPRALAEDREERLIMGAPLLEPGRVDMTRTAGFGPTYGDFKPGLGSGRVVDDDAVSLNVGGAVRVVWMQSGEQLLAGCTDGIHALSGSAFDDAITPTSRRSRRVVKYGCADVPPLLIQGPPPMLVYVMRNRTVLRDLQVGADALATRDLAVLPHHICGRGLAELAWQEPDNIIWIRLDDGGLAALTYHIEHQVFGMTRQALPAGWTVESLASVPTPGGADVVMAAVVRVKAGVTQRRIWRLTQRSEAVWSDAAGLYLGAPATVISGLSHLDGETVSIVADGARVTDQLVVGGSVTLPDAASRVVVGLKMARSFESLPLDMEGVGSTNARTILPTHATVILGGVDALVGTNQPNSAERVTQRPPTEILAPLPKRMRQRVGLGGGAGRDVRVRVDSDAPFDLILYGYRLEAEVTA